MIVVRYAVCSERDRKPITRAVVDSHAEAERMLERVKREDGDDRDTEYWLAELGPECEAWRWLARNEPAPPQKKREPNKRADTAGGHRLEQADGEVAT